MHKLCTKGLRLAGLMAMALAVAHCGDSSVNVIGGGNINPTAGTFSGTTGRGGIVTLGIGSVESATLTCGGQPFGGACNPVINVVESTAIGTCSGVSVDLTFTSNDRVIINDISGGTNCDGSGAADRDSGSSPVTPTMTPVAGVTPPTPTFTPTPDGTGPTAIITPPPGGVTPVETPTPCVGAECCPEAARVEGKAGDAKVLDSGWTGLGHNATVVSDGVLTVALNCSAGVRPCGACSVSGPIENPGKDAGTLDNQRCALDTSIKCTADSDCTSGGCAFFFGSPLPLTAGGVSTCVSNEVTGNISGTANVETGEFQTSVTLTSSVFTGDLDRPCPTCEGDGPANDGIAGGTCNGGLNDGGPCDVNGSSPVSSFGNTSLDCSPGVKGTGIAALPIDLAGSSGTESLVITAGSPNCQSIPFNPDLNPFITDGKCPCPFNGGEATKPNACLNGVCSDVGGGKGECPDTFDTVCFPFETFRGCLSNADCTGGDTCQVQARACFLDNGFIGNQIEAQGTAGAPVNGVSNGVFAATFCIANTTAGAVNAAAGLPGPGRIELPIESREIVNGVVAGF